MSCWKVKLRIFWAQRRWCNSDDLCKNNFLRRQMSLIFDKPQKENISNKGISVRFHKSLGKMAGN